MGAVAALGGGYLLWQQNQLLQQQLSQLTSQQQAQQRQGEDWRSALEGSEQSLTTGLDAQQTQLSDLDSRLNALLGRMDRDRMAWQLVEIEHLLKIANQQLQLNYDVASALKALETADRGLHELGDPALISVRETLSREIQSLKALPELDLTGLVLTLTTLESQVAGLPLRDQPKLALQTEQKASEETGAEGWRATADKMLASLSGLVTIRRQDRAVMPLLAPEERYFLLHNLRLQIEAARLSLLRRDGEGYRVTLAQAREWVNTYFDIQASATQAMLSGLEELAAKELAPQLPDISASLKQLRSFKVGAEPEKSEPQSEPAASETPAKDGAVVKEEAQAL